MFIRLHCLALLAVGIQGSSFQIPTLQDQILRDFEVVSAALARSGEIDFPLNVLETSDLKFMWMCHGPLLQAMRKCTSLDLSDMDLKRLPILAIAHMENLKTLNISKNSGLVISEKDVEYLGMTVEKVIFRYSEAGRETLQRLLGLPRMTILDLSKNDLSKVVDALEGGPEKLQELYLEDCKLGPSVFEKIGRFQRLRILDVSYNPKIGQNMTSELSLGSLKDSLVDLKINDSDLGLDGLKAICSLKKLQRLNIGMNPRIGQKMSNEFDFGGLKDTLLELNIYGSDVGPGGLTAISQCKGISKLALGCNERIGRGLQSDFDLGHLADSLVELDIPQSGLTAEGLEALCRCTKLEKLDVSHNTDIGAGMEEDFDLGNLKNTLVELNIEFTELTAPGLKSIGQCTKLQKLNISCNTVGPDGIDELMLGEMRHSLRDLRARCIDMGIYELGLLCRYTKLERLDVGWNSKIGSVFTDLFSFRALENTLVEVCMDGTDITEDIFGALCRCKAVKTLSIGLNSKVGDYIAELGLGNLQNTVEDLVICAVGLRVEGFRRVCECSKLKTLDIRGNTQTLVALDTEFDFGKLMDSLTSLDMKDLGGVVLGDDIMMTIFRKRGMAQIKALYRSRR